MSLELLNRCNDARVHFKVINGRLCAKNFELVSPELQEEIRKREEELIQLLDPGTEVWVFRELEVPSQVENGSADIWMLGNREDKPGAWRIWHVRTEKSKSRSQGRGL